MGSSFINPTENRYPAHSSNISWAITPLVLRFEVLPTLLILSPQPSSFSGSYREEVTSCVEVVFHSLSLTMPCALNKYNLSHVFHLKISKDDKFIYMFN